MKEIEESGEIEEEEKSQSLEEDAKNNEFLKGVSTVVGAILVNFMAGSIYGLCTVIVYQISYIKGEDPNNFITVDHIDFYYPLEIIFQCLSSFLSGILEKNLGLHLTNLLGFFLLGLGYFIMFLSKNFFIDLLSMIVGGIGNGIIYYPSTKNACLWFMDHNGLIIGILETTISLGSFFFSIIGETIINYEGIESGEDDLYNLDIAQNIKIYLALLIMCVFGALATSYLLMFIKEEEEDILLRKNTITTTSSISKKIFYKGRLKAALKSKSLIIFAIICILTTQGPSMMFTLYRGIGEYKRINIEILQLIGSLNFIFECLSAIIAGILCDYVNLKVLLLIIGGLSTALMSTYCLTFTNGTAFFWYTNIISFIFGATYPFSDCYLMKVFGIDIYIELLGYVNFLSNLVVLLFSPISYLVETELEIKDNAFWILFSIFGGLNFIAFIMTFFIKTEPFNYGEFNSLLSNKIDDSNFSESEQ